MKTLCLLIIYTLLTIDVNAGIIWDAGGNANTNWSRPQNWGPTNGVPTSGVNVSFGTGGSIATVDSNRTVGTITFNRNANFTINGTSNLTINTGITGITVGRTYDISAPIIFGNNNTWSTTTSTTILNITGTVNTLGRNLTINSTGTVNVNSAIISTANLTIGGSGTTNFITNNEQFNSLILNSGTLGLDYKTITLDSNATFTGGTLRISVNSPTDNGKIIAGNTITGNISLGNGTTTLNINSSGYSALDTDQIWVMINNSNGLITGYFNNLTEGSAVVVGGQTMYIHYGADYSSGSMFGGNDIMLCVPEPASCLLLLFSSLFLFKRPIKQS